MRFGQAGFGIFTRVKVDTQNEQLEDLIFTTSFPVYQVVFCFYSKKGDIFNTNEISNLNIKT